MAENKENYLKGINKWLYKCCYENLKRAEDPNIDKLLAVYKPNEGSIPRFAYTRTLKTGFRLVPTEVITTAFKLTDPSILGSEIIYGFMYTNLKKNISSGIYIGTERLVHQIYCTSASLLSRDGEYRQRMNPVFTITKIITEFQDLWNDIEEYVNKKIEKYKWNIFTECFYPKDELKEYSEELETDIVSRRFDIIFLVACWFLEWSNIIRNIKINHTNRLYKSIMRFKDKEEVEETYKFYENINNKYGPATVYMLYNNLSCFTPSVTIGRESQMKIGQKIIPLNLSEIQNPFNIRYKPWREYLILEKIQDFVINNICSGVPLLGDYFYIKNARKTLFDNFVQYMKLEHSEQAIAIARKLIDAQRSTFKPKSMDMHINSNYSTPSKRNENLIKSYKEYDSDVQDPDSFKEIEEWLSGKFRLLYEKISDPVEYAREEIIMSEIAIVFISEYTGRTFYDALNLTISNENYRENTGNMYENYDIWSKYIFELIYTLYCLNSLEGIIHGDLHLNNFTLHPLYFAKRSETQDYSKTYMIYALDKNHFYAFPSRNYHTVVIDFSRAIIRPSMLDKFENFEIQNAKKLKSELKDRIILIKPEERAEFFYEQIIRIIKLYEEHFPDFIATKKSQMSILLLNNFDLLFPILGGWDTYMSINNMMLYFKRVAIDKKYPDQFKLLEDILAICENDLTTIMEKYLDNPKSISLSSIQYTNRKILDSCFKKYSLITPTSNSVDEFIKKNEILDISYYENKRLYGLVTFDTFSDVTKYIKVIDDKGEVTELSLSPMIKGIRQDIEKERIKALNYIYTVSSSYINRIF